MPVAAQTALHPSSEALVEAPVQSVEYAVQMVTPAGPQDIGNLTRTQAIVDGHLVMTSHMVVPMGGVNEKDSTVVAWPSLAPMYGSMSSASESKELLFSDGRATGTAVNGGETTDIDVEVAPTDFGPGIAYRIAQSIPFEEGYVATFSQIEGDGSSAEMQLTVTGSETLAHKGQERAVWVVQEVVSGQSRFTYRVDAETREMLQMEIAPQPGVLIHVTAQ
ncbi:MAG: hypothetical protein Rubg2KO_22640 [Rubricoccaceae bacterium]